MQQSDSAPASARAIIDNIAKVIIGKTPVIEQTLAALIAQGHILVEDVPGVGKTMLAKSLAASLGCEFKRIQFTPDLLPSDITGISIYNQSNGEFEFRPGPVMSQVVLADEINRATPKTQSALLEAMEEWQVSVDGTHPLPGLPLHRSGHSEPHRVRRHLPPAGSAARPLPDSHQPGLPRLRRRTGGDRASGDASTPSKHLDAVASPEDVVRAPGGGPRCLRGRAGAGVHRQPDRGHPQPPGRCPRRIAPRLAGDVPHGPLLRPGA